MSDRVQLGSFLQEGENFMNNLHNQTLKQSQDLTRNIQDVGNNYNKWESIAKQNGFNSMEDVMNFQRQHGLVVDGKVGKNTLAKMQALKDEKARQQDWMSAMNASGYKQSTLKDGSIAFSDGRGNTYYNNGRMRAKGATSNTDYDYKNLKPFGSEQKTSAPTATPSNYWRDHYVVGNRYHYIDGKKYNVKVNTKEDLSYAYDPETNKYIQLEENFMGKPTGVAKGATWMSEDEIPSITLHKRETAWRAANPEPKMRGPLGGTTTPEWKEWSKKAQAARQAGWQKNGGIMTKKYQQGGAAPQQDMQQQVVALVQAAMQGDQKATQQVTQIMEAAQKGDPKAVQLAQLIQEVAKQMQGQATAAKWGAKLRYIKSLKYAKGGKACPACMSEGGPAPKDKNSKVKVAYKDIDGKTYKNVRDLTKDGTLADLDLYAQTYADSYNKDGSYNVIPHKLTASDSIMLDKKLLSPSMRKKYSVKNKCGGKTKKHYFGGWL